MKKLILSATFLISSAAFAGEHCNITSVYFKQESNGVLADTSDFVAMFNKKGERKLESRNYHYTKTGHKSLIIESDCKDNTEGGFFFSECEVKAKIFCHKENKVEAIADRFFTSSAEIPHGKLGARIMLKAIRGLPKCVDHEHSEE